MRQRDIWFLSKASPKNPDIGVWAFGVILDKLANGWMEIEAVKVTGHGVEPGFRDRPVWDDEENGIVGMVVASELISHIRTAHIIPVNLLIKAYPELLQQQIPPSPYRGLFAFEEKHAPYFFGRDYFIQKLVESVRRSPLVTVTGPSGK